MSDNSAQVALVTGSNRGLGLGFVRQLADSMDRVIATCRRPAEADALATLADRHPDSVAVVSMDVAASESIGAAAERVEKKTKRLDLLVNNAGVSGGASSDDFDTVDQESLLSTFRVNAAGPHLVTKAFAPLLRSADGSARVVNITSGYGSIAGTGGGGWHSYKASKAALNMLTRIQAADLRRDSVIVIAMDPGWVRTDMGGSGARISPEESVSKMLGVIADLTMEDTSTFLDYRGREQAW